MVALPISGLFADEIGWESVFYFFGTLGAIWFVFWTIFCYDTPATHPRILEVLWKFINHTITLGIVIEIYYHFAVNQGSFT